MAYKKVNTVVVHTSCSVDFTFEDGANGNYGTIALYQIRNCMDINTIGSTSGASNTELFIPYRAITYAEITSDTEEIEIPADEACVTEGGCVADKDLVTLIAIGRSTIELQSGVYEYSYTESTQMSAIYVETVSDVTSLEIKVNGETVENESDITWNNGDNVVSISVANSCATETYTVTVSYNPSN